MKKDPRDHIQGFVIGTLILLIGLLCACATTSAPGLVTSKQQAIANAVEDSISIGLVPVLTKNPSYVGAAQTVSVALASFTGSSLTPGDVDAVLAKVPQLAATDRAAIAGLVNAAWGVYAKRYAQQVGSSVRPDVKLFLVAVSNGIDSAVVAVPHSP